MTIYNSFIYENHNLRDHKPEWMNAERYEYCEQVNTIIEPKKSFIKSLISRYL